MLVRLINRLKYNSRYLIHAPWDTGITPPEVLKFITNRSPGRALDLGAGSGTNIITLANAGWDAVGVEYAFLAVASARKKIRHAGVNAKIYLHDVIDLDFLRGPFDLILDIGCYHSLGLNDKKVYNTNLLRLLNKGGTLLMYAFLSEDSSEKTGISQQDINNLSNCLKLISGVKGKERDIRNSIWLEFNNE